MAIFRLRSETYYPPALRFGRRARRQGDARQHPRAAAYVDNYNRDWRLGAQSQCPAKRGMATGTGRNRSDRGIGVIGGEGISGINDFQDLCYYPYA